MEGSLGMENDQQQISGFRGTAEGGALKNVSGWSEPNVGATNSAGYSGIPGGGRNDLSAYYLQGIYGLWWTSGIVDLNYGWSRRLDFSYPFVDRYAYKKQFGFSIRCIKD